MSEQNWVRSEIIQALRQGYTGGDAATQQACIEGQADAIMILLDRIASEPDTFHLLVGYLNNMRLEAARERRRDRENEEESNERTVAGMGELRRELGPSADLRPGNAEPHDA